MSQSFHSFSCLQSHSSPGLQVEGIISSYITHVPSHAVSICFCHIFFLLLLSYLYVFILLSCATDIIPLHHPCAVRSYLMSSRYQLGVNVNDYYSGFIFYNLLQASFTFSHFLLVCVWHLHMYIAPLLDASILLYNVGPRKSP